MHARELIDLAVFVASQGPVLIGSVRQVPTAALAQYWTVSKCRLDRWNRTLREVQPPSASCTEETVGVRNLQAVCAEILVSEMLTRVWSSILTAMDYVAGSSEAQPVAASVMAGHLEASNRVLNLISYNPQNAENGGGLNHLRRLTERWTDLLLGSLGSLIHAASFAHDAARTEEFSRDFDRSHQPQVRARAWHLIATSLRATFDAHLRGVTPNTDLNNSIAGAILICFPGYLFDSTGVYHSLWNLRLSAVATDTQAMVDQLLAADSPPKASAAQFSRKIALPKRTWHMPSDDR
ncbi:MAG TPA: hypothetical protein VFE46_09275 [Pirellulales bacterium]|jgi:hypothetical protein|nr:hypothetical protein [Pirellulales bacterium]